MPRKPFPADVLEQAQSVANAWSQINEELTFGDLTLSALNAELGEAGSLQSQLDALETQMTNLRNQRDDRHASIWDKVKRVRAAVKGIYGDDSSEYEMVGGTRLSERKSPARKTSGTD
jgi:hypothetical protein